MPETTTRRAHLLAAIRNHGCPVTTQLAEQLMTGSPWPTTGRNTTRKDLRALTARGLLTAVDMDGRRIYHPTTTPEGPLTMSTLAPRLDHERVIGQIERGEAWVGPDAARKIASRHEEEYGEAFTGSPAEVLRRRLWAAALASLTAEGGIAA
jgi:predicted transcriptional regulator